MKKIFVVLVCSLIFVTSTVSFATTPEIDNCYIGGNIGVGSVQLNFEKNGVSVYNKIGFGGNVNAGYMFNQHVAIEGDFLWYPDQEYKSTAWGVASVKSVNNYGGALSIIGAVPFNGGFYTFGELGVAVIHHKQEIYRSDKIVFEINKVAPAAFFGAGIGYALTKNVSMNFNANITTKNGSVPSMWQATIGLSYTL